MRSNDIDFSTGAAVQFQALFNSLLEEARNKNDADLSMEETQKLRGRIALLKELIALPKTQKVMEAQSRLDHPDY